MTDSATIKAYVLTIARHAVAAIVAAVMGMLTTNIPLTEDAAQDVEVALTGLALAVVLFSYAAAEKTLKPFFQRFGEIQPGEVTPATSDMERRKVQR